MTTKERRYCKAGGPKVEKRNDGDGEMIVGYAAVFYDAADPGTEYRIWADLVERIMPGAFDKALQEDDVRGLANHDNNRLLGRNKSGTLRLSVDERGLRYEIDLPDSATAREVAESIRRGDMDGSSFQFSTYGKRGRVVWVQESDHDIRQIEEVELFDVGPVTFPAYESTTAELRDRIQDVLEERDRWKEQRRKQDEADQRGCPACDDLDVELMLDTRIRECEHELDGTAADD